MEKDDILNYFQNIINKDRKLSEAVAAIMTLLKYIELSPATTLYELRRNLESAVDYLKTSKHAMVASISSGCELFLRFITLTGNLDHSDFQKCKETLLGRGHVFIKRTELAREKISRLANPFIQDGMAVLTHSKSRVVQQLLFNAAKGHKRGLTVYVTQSLPDQAGAEMCRQLTANGINAVLILDSAIGYVMERVDIVLVGAEGVVENGGIINKVGTFTMAVCAKAMNKPFYVVAESFKFVRVFPLNQCDIPSQFQYTSSSALPTTDSDLEVQKVMVDYTPPSYITLLFTDLGILTPSAVSDELIKLYL